MSGHSKARIPHFSWWYPIVSLVFMLLGGYVATLVARSGFITEDPMKCFGAGVALPALVSALALRLK